MTSERHAITRRITPRRPMYDRLADTPGRRGAAKLVLSLGPATIVAGMVWALLQPHRVTLLNPGGESFWWLAVEPPLLVVLVGAAFHIAVARGLVRDLLEADRSAPSRR